MNTEQLKDILHRYRLGLCTEEEAAAVSEWYHTLELRSDIDPDENTLSAFERSIEEKIRLALQEEKRVAARPFYRRSWLRYAALLLVIVGPGGYVFFLRDIRKPIAAIHHPASAPVDLAPGGNKARLTLANGEVILLDSAANGSLAQQGNIKIIKLENGRLAYANGQSGKRTNGVSEEILYNTITTPRGGQYQLTLADGTKVWLNAASSLRFPASFDGKERNVQITGEAYLEVAPDAARPFKVATAFSEIEVLGTDFNVNAYADEAAAKTTLINGRVKVISLQPQQRDALLLGPGQQALLGSNGKLQLIEKADIEEAVAWRKGKFLFNSADIQTIMRQIARWYDVEVIFKEPINMHFSGYLNREVNASEVFRKLSLTEEVRFEIKGNKVIVMKK